MSEDDWTIDGESGEVPNEISVELMLELVEQNYDLNDPDWKVWEPVGKLGQMILTEGGALILEE